MAALKEVTCDVAFSSPANIFVDPISQLAPLSPMAALAATNPVAALTSGSPTLQIFNPAVNPSAAFLAFDPASAAALAVAPHAFGLGQGPFSPFSKGGFGGFGGIGKGISPFKMGKFSPFGMSKFGKF